MIIDRKILFPPKIGALTKEQIRTLSKEEAARQADFVRKKGNPFVLIKYADETNAFSSTGFFLQEYRGLYIIATCAHSIANEKGKLANTISVTHQYETPSNRMKEIGKKLGIYTYPENVVRQLDVVAYFVSDRKSEDLAFIAVKKPEEDIHFFKRSSQQDREHFPFAFCCKMQSEAALLYAGSFLHELVVYRDNVFLEDSMVRVLNRKDSVYTFKMAAEGKSPYYVCSMYAEKGASGSPVWNSAGILHGIHTSGSDRGPRVSSQTKSYYILIEQIEDAFGRLCGKLRDLV
jgi:hypothetical protein